MSSSLSILGDRDYTLVAAELRSSTTIYTSNSFDYNFFNLGNGEYGKILWLVNGASLGLINAQSIRPVTSTS